MNAVKSRVREVIIVDAKLDDYDMLLAELDWQDVRVKLLATAEAALRAMQAAPSTLWMINTELPDMPGASLMALIRRRAGRCPVILVGDSYSPDDELAARAAGATAYVCKPPRAAWLDSRRYGRRSHDVRAGPPFL